jgi:rifampicin phosphotransferase
MASHIVWFRDRDCTDLAVVGGKGANLGRMTQQGFVVPPGFVVGTDAYMAHMEQNAGLKKKVADVLASIDYSDADNVEANAKKIRVLIASANMPKDVAAAIEAAYANLGDQLYVAVRSSGTAEDLTGASFAGLHDTYLDIRGSDNVVDAVKRCWASLWTGRAVSYRSTQGFDHFKISIAIVVQTMVESEVSGVMFTGNPINTATDQIMINASYGLGEAVVSGMVTPDEFIVWHRDQRVLARSLGTKEKRIRRDPSKGSGTITEDVPADQRELYSLSDDQIAELSQIGLRIQDAYDGFPQDIEWGYSGGKFYVLQARPITAVDFSWDVDVTTSIGGNDENTPYDTIWSRAFPEEMWTGGITPLMFSWRAIGLNQMTSTCMNVYGFPELDYTTRRYWSYYKGASYYNCEQDRQEILLTVPPHGRETLLGKLPVAWHKEVLEAPFDWARYTKWFELVENNRPDMGKNWWRHFKALYDDPVKTAEFDGLDYQQLAKLSDDELKKYIWHMISMEIKTYDMTCSGLLYGMREGVAWLNWMVANWYDGGRAGIALDLISGAREPTITGIENHELWMLAQEIHKSTKLKELLRQYPDRRFIEMLDDSDAEYVSFREKYAKYVKDHGHRGHSDRDIYFIRRAEDPSVDVRVFRSLMGTPDPAINEARGRERLEETIRHVSANFRSKEMGFLKAQAFEMLIDFLHSSIAWRDFEREFIDRSTFAIKRGYNEVARRVRERQPGVFTSERDHYFLTMQELYDVLDGKARIPLTQAKIAARMKHFDKVDTKEVYPVKYLQFGLPADIDAPEVHGEGVFKGRPVSLGKTTGIARVVLELKNIGRVKPGEILIVNSTDPGWTPVFTIIKGIVLETGGTTSHGALLAREYGFPGVQLAGALKLIPDGATITVDGTSGQVIVHQDVDHPDALAKAA